MNIASILSIPESLCRTHLEKVTGSVTFCRAGQLRRLLTWIAERSLVACPVAPSEKEIGEVVLGRQDFDPQTDSLVRKEMSRLREKLSRYYLLEGLHDDFRISADSGYLLRFERREIAKPGSGRPCWLVLPFRSNSELTDDGDQLLEELLMELGESGDLELVAPTTALGYRDRSGDVRQFATENHADFVVEGSLRRKNELIEATAWLVDGQTGRAQRFKRIMGSDPAGLARLTAAWLLEEDAGD